MSAFLDACALQSDAKSASVLMIMSDTFYCLETVAAAPAAESAVRAVPAAAAVGAPAAAEAAAAAAAESGAVGAPGAERASSSPATWRRKYLQAGVLRHRIWRDMGFWEEAFLLSVREAVQGTCAHLAESAAGGGGERAAEGGMSSEAAYLYKQIVFGQLGSWLLNLVNFRVPLRTITKFMTRMSIANGLGMEERLALLAKLDTLAG